VYFVKPSRSVIEICWLLIVVTAPFRALTAGISIDMMGAEEPGR
jgi:hypothetical protein